MYRIFFVFLSIGIIFSPGCSNKRNSSESRQNDSTVGYFNGKKKPIRINEFYFVGMIGENPGIYKFISKSQPSGLREEHFAKFWSKHNEKVVKLSYSPDKKTIFFLTASDFGKKAVLPFIDNIKLYEINPDSSTAKFLKFIGNGLQIFTLWGQDKTFRVVLNAFDKNSADYVNQQSFIYNESGKIVSINSRKFNIVKEGYPQLVEKISMTSSPGSRYSIFAVDSTLTSIYLQSNSDGKVKLITSTDQRLNQADWSLNEQYLVFSTVAASRKINTEDAAPADNSKIFIYSIEKNKIIKSMDAEKINNFFITGDLLIFDKGIRKNSFIEILNIKTLKPFYSIHIHNGCGLRSIL